VTLAAGASTAYTKKAFKYLASVTPNFTDTHTITVGTSDVFGLNYNSPVWDQTDVFWSSSFMTTSTGWTAPDATATATATTGDVRGTIQVSATGGGTGIGTTASNGSLSGLILSGNRFTASLFPLVHQAILATANNSVSLYGVTQA
jgi:hypothetical protein